MSVSSESILVEEIEWFGPKAVDAETGFDVESIEFDLTASEGLDAEVTKQAELVIELPPVPAGVSPEAWERIVLAGLAEGREMGLKEGHEQGYQEGLQTGFAAGAEKAAEQVTRLEEMVSEGMAPFRAGAQALQGQLAELVFALAGKVLGRPVVRRQWVSTQLEQALACIPEMGQAVVIRLHPEDAQALDNSGHHEGIEIIEDPSLARGHIKVDSGLAGAEVSIEKTLRDVKASFYAELNQPVS